MITSFTVKKSMDQQQSSLLWLLLFASILLLQLLRKRAARNLHLPPGPKRLPVIGNLHQVVGATPPHRSLLALAREHGPLMSLMLGATPTLVVSSSDMAREVFEAHDLDFSGRPPLYAARKLSYGFLDVAFAPYGEHWRQARKTCVLELLSLKRVGSFRAVREGEVASLVAKIERQSSNSSSSSSSAATTINLSRLVHSLGSSVMRRVVFGDERAGRGRCGGELRDVLEETQKLLGGFCAADFFPWLGWWHGVTGLERRLRKNFEELDGIYSRVIDEHLNETSSSSGGPPDDEDLVHVLLRLQKDRATHGSTSSMDHIKALLTDMFIAGTDTSSAAIIWTMTELVRNPTVMNKAQQEIRTVVGDKPAVEESELELLDYLKLVVKEALRLHPPAPLLVPRETIGACSVGGYDVPAKTRVFINAAAIATDPANWESPAEFRPERFLDSGIDFRGHDFELIPFGFGRRGCPGMNFAVVEVELTLANLLHCFDWELPIGMAAKDLDLDEAFGLTVHKKNDLCLVAKSKQGKIIQYYANTGGSTVAFA